MTCSNKKHAKYKAMRRPQAACLDCWKIWAAALEKRLRTMKNTKRAK